jgi:hypothetical protein
MLHKQIMNTIPMLSLSADLIPQGPAGKPACPILREAPWMLGQPTAVLY